ncbi:hypothetical protein ACI79P_07540 [Blastococcus sp. SYSU DS0510]
MVSIPDDSGPDLVERILRALEAGESTGADTEGALSGSVQPTRDDPLGQMVREQGG